MLFMSSLLHVIVMVPPARSERALILDAWMLVWGYFMAIAFRRVSVISFALIDVSTAFILIALTHE
jgi:hypothetical protein